MKKIMTLLLAMSAATMMRPANYITNGTDKTIKFRQVMDRVDRQDLFFTVKPGETVQLYENDLNYRIDIDIDHWPENAAWKNLPNKRMMPLDDFQRTNSTYYGIGQATGWGVSFDGRPRGTFRMKGPSVKYPPFYDPNLYLCLSDQ